VLRGNCCLLVQYLTGLSQLLNPRSHPSFSSPFCFSVPVIFFPSLYAQLSSVVRFVLLFISSATLNDRTFRFQFFRFLIVRCSWTAQRRLPGTQITSSTSLWGKAVHTLALECFILLINGSQTSRWGTVGS